MKRFACLKVVKQKEEAVKAAVKKNNVQQESLTAWSNKVDTMGDAVERIMRSAKISDSVLSLTKWRGTQNKKLKALNQQFHKVKHILTAVVSMDSNNAHDAV